MATNPAMVIKIEAALDKLKSQLSEGSFAIETTTQKMVSMANAYSGTRTVQQAHDVMAAIDAVGGVTKLTANEQAKANRILDEAIAKYQAMGREAPPAMVELQKATEGAGTSTRVMAGGVDTGWAAVSRFAGALGIGLGVGALVSFGKSVFDTASNVGDMADKLGVSAEFTQRMSYVAGQSGTTIDAFGTAISKMNVLLSAGEDSTIEALKKVGLSFADVRAKKPEEAFLAIAESIRKIPDPMLQSEMAYRLFGKAFQELMPAIKGGIEEVAAQTTVMSDETVRRLKAAQDTWESLKNKGVILTGEALSSLGEYLQSGFSGAVLSSGSNLDVLRDTMVNTDIATGNLAAVTSVYANTLSDTLPPMADAMAKLKEFDGENRESEAQMRRSIAAFDAHNASVKSLADQWSGAKLAERVKLFAEALIEVGGASGIAASQMAGVVKEIGQFLAQGAELDASLMNLYMSHQNFNESVSTGYAAIMKNINMTAKYKDTLIELPPVLTDVVFRSEAVAESTDRITESVTRSATAALTWSQAMDLVNQGLGTMSGTIGPNMDFSTDKRREIQKAYDEHRYYGPIMNGGPDWKALGFDVPGRAEGGPVEAGKPYIVGERQAELFVPTQSGTIYPSLGAAGGMTNHITIQVTHPLGTPDAIATAVGNALTQRMRSLGMRFAGVA